MARNQTLNPESTTRFSHILYAERPGSITSVIAA